MAQAKFHRLKNPLTDHNTLFVPVFESDNGNAIGATRIRACLNSHLSTLSELEISSATPDIHVDC